MARLPGKGLKYFPLVTDFFEDRQIRRLTTRCGQLGPLMYIYILCRIYSQGCFIPCDSDFIEDAALDLHSSPDSVKKTLACLAEKKLIDPGLYHRKILSSHGIQQQYLESCRGMKRRVEIEPEICLLSGDGTGNCPPAADADDSDNSEIMLCNSGIKGENSGIEPLNKRKGNKTKLKEREVPPPDKIFLEDLADRAGISSNAHREELEHFCEKLSPEILEHALQRERQQGHSGWSYLRGILRSYLHSGLCTLTQVLEEEQHFQLQGGRNVSASCNFTEPIDMDELRRNLEQIGSSPPAGEPDVRAGNAEKREKKLLAAE